MEKCAVCAASPISTTGVWPSAPPFGSIQVLQTTRGKRIHCAEPRRCAAFDISAWPPRYLANSFSQNAMLSSLLISFNPAACQTASGASTMKVEVDSSKRYACA